VGGREREVGGRGRMPIEKGGECQLCRMASKPAHVPSYTDGHDCCSSGPNSHSFTSKSVIHNDVRGVYATHCDITF
jgi:hypothetical protein